MTTLRSNQFLCTSTHHHTPFGTKWTKGGGRRMARILALRQVEEAGFGYMGVLRVGLSKNNAKVTMDRQSFVGVAFNQYRILLGQEAFKRVQDYVIAMVAQKVAETKAGRPVSDEAVRLPVEIFDRGLEGDNKIMEGLENRISDAEALSEIADITNSFPVYLALREDDPMVANGPQAKVIAAFARECVLGNTVLRSTIAQVSGGKVTVSSLDVTNANGVTVLHQMDDGTYVARIDIRYVQVSDLRVASNIVEGAPLISFVDNRRSQKAIEEMARDQFTMSKSELAALDGEVQEGHKLYDVRLLDHIPFIENYSLYVGSLPTFFTLRDNWSSRLVSINLQGQHHMCHTNVKDFLENQVGIHSDGTDLITPEDEGMTADGSIVYDPEEGEADEAADTSTINPQTPLDGGTAAIVPEADADTGTAGAADAEA